MVGLIPVPSFDGSWVVEKHREECGFGDDPRDCLQALKPLKGMRGTVLDCKNWPRPSRITASLLVRRDEVKLHTVISLYFASMMVWWWSGVHPCVKKFLWSESRCAIGTRKLL